MQRIVFDNENKKSYEIADSNGNVRGIICVDTTDLDIFVRSEKAAKKMQEIMSDEELQKYENVDKIENYTIVETTDRLMKEQIDYVFGEGVSEIVFGGKNCLNIRGGRTLAEIFIDVMMKEVGKDLHRQTVAGVNEKNIDKYTNAYKSSDYSKNYRRKNRK